MAKKPPPTAPVRIKPSTYETAKRIQKVASLNGWAALGIQRTDPPTLQAVFEVAIELLAQRAQGQA
jgi:hypothetical protein